MLSCNQNSAVYNTLYHKLMKNVMRKVWDREIPLQYHLSAERWADSINMWPNAVLIFNYRLGVQIDCLDFRNKPTVIFF